jgi:tellurite resistance protein
MIRFCQKSKTSRIAKGTKFSKQLAVDHDGAVMVCLLCSVYTECATYEEQKKSADVGYVNFLKRREEQEHTIHY